MYNTLFLTPQSHVRYYRRNYVFYLNYPTFLPLLFSYYCISVTVFIPSNNPPTPSPPLYPLLFDSASYLMPLYISYCIYTADLLIELHITFHYHGTTSTTLPPFPTLIVPCILLCWPFFLGCAKQAQNWFWTFLKIKYLQLANPGRI